MYTYTYVCLARTMDVIGGAEATAPCRALPMPPGGAPREVQLAFFFLQAPRGLAGAL